MTQGELAFNQIRRPKPEPAGPAPATIDEFRLRLTETVGKRLTRLSGLSCVMVPIDLPYNVRPKPALQPPHPECMQVTPSEDCLDKLTAHIEAIRERAETHWHRCSYGHLCALVPVVWDDISLAACKMVCPHTMTEATFERHIELLEVLIENFVANESNLLARLMAPPERATQIGHDAPITPEGARALADHPRVIEALEHVDRHVTSSDMSVRSIATALDINPTYLAHLFAEQIGVRLSHYISSYRIERAKKLLATTNWQVKRVSYKSGHANADWFSQVFRKHTGLSPREYRRQVRLG